MLRIVFTAHCILNDYTRVFETDSECYTLLNKLLYELRVRGYRIVQLPCPELLLMGRNREPMTREEYRKAGLEDVVKKLIVSIEEYIERLDGVEIAGLIGISGSPSCGLFQTHITSKYRREEGMGLFMEYLVPLLKRYNPGLVLVEFDYRRPSESVEYILGKL